MLVLRRLFALDRLFALLWLLALSWLLALNRLLLLLLGRRRHVHQVCSSYRGERASHVIADTAEGTVRPANLRQVLKEGAILVVDKGALTNPVNARIPERITGGKLEIDVQSSLPSANFAGFVKDVSIREGVIIIRYARSH